ncbi:MAG: chemotaxis protein CheW [Bryobacteraceae bacterium]
MNTGGQFLTFTVGEQTYGIDILDIQEIRGGGTVTPVPHAPPHVRGVMNLRGTIVPVVDLRRRFGVPEIDFGRFTVIVVVAVEGRTIGFVVDTVSEVRDLAGAAVTPPPWNGGGERFLTGVAAGGEELVMLLDLPRLIRGHAAGQVGESDQTGKQRGQER